MKKTEWRPIPGWEDAYKISDAGDVVRIASWDLGMRWVAIRTPSGQPLKCKFTHNGYHSVALYRGSKAQFFFVHRLVAAAFIGPRPEGYSVNHKNGKKTDNRVENLEYMTPGENSRHRIAVLGQHGVRGAANWHSKLTESQIQPIRDMRASGVPIAEVARHFGVCKSTISMITKGHKWTHV